jgi:hypothetical protein
MYRRAILAAYGFWIGVPVVNGCPVVATRQQWNQHTALFHACVLRNLQWRVITRRLQRWWRTALAHRRRAAAILTIQRAWRQYCPLASRSCDLRAQIETSHDRLLSRLERPWMSS